MSVSSYVINFWPDQHSCTSYLNSIGQTWTASGTHHWSMSSVTDRVLEYRLIGTYSSTWNPTSMNIYTDYSISSVVIQFQSGSSYVLNYTDVNRTDKASYFYYAFDSVSKKLRDDQWLIFKSSESTNPAIFTQEWTYAAASADIVSQTICGKQLVPETNFIDALSSIIDRNNGCWVSPASGDSSIVAGNWYPYNPNCTSVTAWGDDKEYVLSPHYYANDSDDYQKIYRKVDLDALTTNYDWLVIGIFEKPEGSASDADYIPYHQPMIFDEFGKRPDVLKYWYNIGEWLNRPLSESTTADYEMKGIFTAFILDAPSYENNYSSGLKKIQVKASDPATANPLLWNAVESSPTPLGLTGVWQRDISVQVPSYQHNGIIVKIKKGERDNVLARLKCAYAPMTAYNEDFVVMNGNFSNAMFNIRGTSTTIGVSAYPKINIKFQDLIFDKIGMYCWQHYNSTNPGATTTYGVNLIDNNAWYRFPKLQSIISTETLGQTIFENLSFTGISCSYVVRGYYNSGGMSSSGVWHPSFNVWSQDGGLSANACSGITVQNCNFNDLYSCAIYYNKFAHSWIDQNPNLLTFGPQHPLSPYIIKNCEFNRIGRTICTLWNVPKNSLFVDNKINKGNMNFWESFGSAFTFTAGATADTDEYTVVVSGNTVNDAGVAFDSIPKFYLGYNTFDRDITINDYERGTYYHISVSPNFIYDNQEYSIIENNVSRKSYFQNILMEGNAPVSAWSTTYHIEKSWAPTDYIRGSHIGHISHVKIRDNVFTKLLYMNKLRGDTETRADNYGYPFIWFSENYDVECYNNVFVGSEFDTTLQSGTAIDGTTLSGAWSTGLIMGSCSGISIHDNKFSYIMTALRLNWTDAQATSNVFDDSEFGSFGQLNDISYYNNTIYQISESFMFMKMPKFDATITIDPSLFGTSAQTVATPPGFSNQLALYTQQTLSGQGDDYYLHQGESKNWRFYDNKIIQDGSFSYWSNRYIVQPSWARSVFPTGASGYNFKRFIYFQPGRGGHNYVNKDGNTYNIGNIDALHFPKIAAEKFVWADEGSTISGNTFYGDFDDANTNIEWIVWNNDPVDSVTSTYPASSDSMLSCDYNKASTDTWEDPIVGNNYASYRSQRMNAWRAASTSNNWWLHTSDYSQYRTGDGTNLACSFKDGTNNYMMYPLISRYRTSSDGRDGMMTLSSWCDYLNNATTGMRGSGNEVINQLPNLNYTFDINNPNEFLEEAPASAIVFNFYSSLESLNAAGKTQSVSGFDFYTWSDHLKNSLGAKMTGLSNSYNPLSACYYEDPSISAIIINFPDEYYYPNALWANKYRLDNSTTLDSNPNGVAQIKLRDDQVLILSGGHSSGRTTFTNKKTLLSVLNEVSGYGLSAYDLIWDGTNKYATLTAIEYAISGCFISTSDSGSIYVKNLDAISGYPQDYGYNGHQTLTANINPDYEIWRFGPVKNGVTGYEIPGLFCEDGRIANAYELKSCFDTYYDLIRWLGKELPSTSDYEIIWIGDNNIFQNSDNVLSANIQEYINGEMYDDGISLGNSRSPVFSSKSLSAYSSASNGYSGIHTDTIIPRYRDMSVKWWEGGSYLKVKKASINTVKNILNCSYISPSGAPTYIPAAQPGVFWMYSSSTSYPISNVKFENMKFEYIGMHSWDGPTCMNTAGVHTDAKKSLTGYYYSDPLNPSVTSVFWWSSFVGRGDKYAISSSDVPAGLSGYPRNWIDKTMYNGSVLKTEQVKNVMFENITISSCINQYISIHVKWVSGNKYMSLTSISGFSANNVVIKDVGGYGISQQYLGVPNAIAPPEYSDYIGESERVFSQYRQAFEYPQGQSSVTNCQFIRCGNQGLNMEVVGSPSWFTNNLFDNCSYMSNHSTKTCFTVQTTDPLDAVVFNSNTAYNGECIFISSNFIASGNWIEYNFCGNDYEKFKPGRGNGIDTHSDYYSNSVSSLIIDNYCLNCPEDAILSEGVSPWGQPNGCWETSGTLFNNHIENNMNGYHKGHTITGNVLTSKFYLNNGRFRHGEQKNSHAWASTVWLSDTHETLFKNNIVLGMDYKMSSSSEIDEWGQTISAWPNFGFIIDSTSAITISNNKIGLCNGIFHIRYGSGILDTNSFTDENWWGAAGQVNSLTINNNIFFEDFRELFSFRLHSYFYGDLDSSYRQTSTTYQTIAQNVSGSITAFSALTGIGDMYNYHEGKSRNLKIYDNEWIRYDKTNYTDLIPRITSGYPTTPRGINFSLSDTWSPRSNYLRTEGSKVFGFYFMIGDTNYFADHTPFGDDNSVMSGNTFYNFDSSEKNIEWLEWKEDPQNYIDTEYATDPTKNSYTDPYLQYSAVSATNYANWKIESAKRNWWLREQNASSVTNSGMTLSWKYTDPADSSKFFIIPKLARVRQDNLDDSLFNLTEWVDYLNTASTGMKGTGNAIESTIPNLNYTFDINNPNEFLEPYTSNNSISALNYASFSEVYQYRRFPRRAITFKNISSNSISGLQFSFLTNDFVIWDSILPTTAAVIPAGEQFTIQFDFQPQSIGNVFGTLNINYIENGTEYTDSITSISGVGIAIPTANYYVSTTGNDNNDGSITAPFATIKKAFGMCSSGELIYVRDGEYDEHLGTYYGGASANVVHDDAIDWTWNITIASYPGEQAIIKRNSNGIAESSSAMAFLFGLTSEKYFTFEDMIFDGIAATAAASASFYLGACTWHSSYIKFWNCEFKNRHDWGYPTLSGVNRSFNTCLGISTTGIEFWYCKIYNYDEHGIYLSSSSGHVRPSSPAYLPRSACYCKFMYNEMYNGGMNATGQVGYYQSFGFHGNNNNTVETEGSWYYPFEVGNLIEGNYVHNITSGGVLLGGNLASTAQNNICVSCSGGGILDYYSGCSANHFYNNTTINCSIGGRFTQSSSACIVKNNIFYNSTSYDYYDQGAKSIIVTNNLTEDSTLSVTAGNLYSTDPLFVDVNNNVYNLRSDSPCIDYGYNISSLTSDFYNLPRSYTNDIGAVDYFEYEAPSPTPTTGSLISSVNRGSGGIIVYPNQFKMNTGQITELQEIVDNWLDDRQDFIQFKNKSREWIKRFVDETVEEKTDIFYFLNLVKMTKRSIAAGNDFWRKKSLEDYFNYLSPNSEISKDIK